jgi:TP901 family phage tail tape measure protein/lambda family phage tail tape measure protein
MSETGGTNAAATLSLQINTQPAHSALNELETRMLSLGVRKVGTEAPPAGITAITTGAKQAEKSVAHLAQTLQGTKFKFTPFSAGSGDILAGFKDKLSRELDEIKASFDSKMKVMEGTMRIQAAKLASSAAAATDKAGSSGGMTDNMRIMLRSAEMTGAASIKAGEAQRLASERQITQEMVAQAAARELNVTGARAAERAKILAEEKRITQELKEQAQWAAMTNKERAAATVKAARVLYTGPAATGPERQSQLSGASGSGPALAAAQAAGSLTAAEKALADSIKGTTNAQANWSKAANEAHAAARGLAGSLGNLWLTYGSLAPLLAGAALGAAFKRAATAGSELEYQLTFVKALGDESTEAVQKLSDAAMTLGQNSMVGPVALASGFRVLAQAGLQGADALLAMNSVMDLSVTGEMDMAQAGTTLVGVMNAFSLGVTDAGRVGDVFAKAAALSQTSVQGMTEAMKTASVVGEQYGAALEDTATALTLLAKVNIYGTSAGTAYRNMLKELYAPTKGAADVMKQLGLKTSDAAGNLKAFPDIIYDLRERLAEFTRGSQVDILQKLFGERGSKEAIAMLGKTREGWDKLKASISSSSGFMREVTAQLEATTKGTLAQAMNTMEVAMVSAFNNTKGPMKDLAVQLKSIFSSDEFKSSVEGAVATMAGLGKVVLGVTEVVLKLASAMPSGTSTIATMGIAAAAMGLTVSSLIPKLAGVAAGLVGLNSAAVASLAVWGPLGLAVAAVTAAYVAYNSTTPAVISNLNGVNAALSTQNNRLQEVNKALNNKIALELKARNAPGGSNSVELDVARRAIAEGEAEIARYNKIIQGDRKGQSTGAGFFETLTAPFRKSEAESKVAAAKQELRIQEGYQDENYRREAQARSLEMIRQAEELDKLKAGTNTFSVPKEAKAGGAAKPNKDFRKIAEDNLASAIKQEQIQLGMELLDVEIELAAQTISSVVATEKKNAATKASLEIERLFIEASLADAKAAGDQLQITKFQNDLDENAVKIKKQEKAAILDVTRATTADTTAKKDISVATENYIQDLKFERDALDLTAQQVAKLRIEREKERAEADLKLRSDRNLVTPEQEAAERAAIAARAAARQEDEDYRRSYVGGWKSAYKEWADNAGSEAKRAADTFNTLTSSMESALDEFLTTGKLNFAKFATDIIAQIAKIEAKALLSKAMDSGGTSSGGFGGIVGGIMKFLGLGGGGGISGGLDLPNIIGTATAPWAKGGVFSGSPSLHSYVNTVQTSPQSFAYANVHKFAKGGVFAEAGPEAVMPLARDTAGRLGVKSQGGSGRPISITVNVNGTNAPDVRRAAGQGAREALSALNGARRYG